MNVRVRRLHYTLLLTLYPLLFTLCSCAAAKPPALPSGDGTPFPAFATAYTEATEACQNVKTLTAVMSLSGRVGSQKLRGRVDAGLETPDRLVLEATAPWGKPYFVLGAAAGEATLVLPREGRVLRGARPEAIVEALTGVSLTPAELRGILSGCGLTSGPAASGRTFDGGWASIDAGGTTMWLRQIDGRWRLAASVRGSMFVHYSDFTAAHPGTVRVRMTSSGTDAADLTLRLSDVERNATLPPGVFTIDVPGDAVPVTLTELRRAGPLGRQSP